MQNVSKDLTHQLESMRLFFFAFNWSIVDLQCCVWGVEQSDSDMYNKYICGIHKCVCVCVCVCVCACIKPIQWTSLIAELIKKPPAMQETPVWLLGQEVTLEKG